MTVTEKNNHSWKATNNVRMVLYNNCIVCKNKLRIIHCLHRIYRDGRFYHMISLLTSPEGSKAGRGNTDYIYNGNNGQYSDNDH